jgi:hypothetical protein
MLEEQSLYQKTRLGWGEWAVQQVCDFVFASTSNKMRSSAMSKTYKRAAMLLLAATVAVPLICLAFPARDVASAEVVAPCHGEAPVTGTPAMPNHDCCIVGHNQAAPSHAPVLSAPVLAVANHLPSISSTIPVPQRREPALTSFDPPLSTLSLRI